MIYGIIGLIICHIVLLILDLIIDIKGYQQLGFKYKVRVGELFFIIIEIATICTLLYIYS